MSKQKDPSHRLQESGRARRRFLQSTALMAAGTSAAALTGVRAATAATASDAAAQNCPAVETPLKDVEGKVAFITGGDSGIGLGIARAFTQAGMKVVITYRSAAHLDEAMKALENVSSQVHAISLDVTDRAGMEKAAVETLQVFKKIHVLVNNAGVAPLGGLSSATFDDWDWTIGVNLTGTFNGVRTFLPRIQAQGEGGQIIAISSVAGLLGHGPAGVYSTSKFGLVGMMESLRNELQGGKIGVSVCCPGIVNTRITDSERNRPAALPKAGFKPNPEMLARMQAQMKKGPLPGMDPLELGQRVLRGMRNNDLYILSTPELLEEMQARGETILASMPSDVTVPDGRIMLTHGILGKTVYVAERSRQRCQRGRTTKA